MTRLGVWVLDGDPGHTNLLHYALNETNYAHTLVILTVSMTQPWGWLEQLNHWIKVLGQHIESLQLDAKEKEAARQRLATTWQSYCEVGDDLDPGSPVKRTMRNNSIDEDDLLPLTEDALITNLGLDIVVVVTKVGTRPISWSTQMKLLSTGDWKCNITQPFYFSLADGLHDHTGEGVRVSRRALRLHPAVDS